LTASQARVEATLAIARGELDAAKGEGVAEHERALADHAEMQTKLDGLEKSLADLRTELAVSERIAIDRHAELATLKERLTALTRERDELAAELQHGAAERAALDARIAALEAERDASASQVSQLCAERDGLLAARDELAAELRHGASERAALDARIAGLESERDASAARLAELSIDRDVWTAERTAAEETARALAEAESRVRRGEEHLQQLGRRSEHQDRALESQRAETETALSRAKAAEALVEQANERIRRLEQRVVLRVEDAAQATVAVPKSGTLGLTELVRLVAELASGRADVRIDLAIPSGLRRLWLVRGALAAATSTLRPETLSERARRDGLIDARAAADLAELHGEPIARELDELLSRRLLRRSEVDGLVQRHIENIALEAFSEPECTYFVHEESPGAQVMLAASRRPLPPILAQALRRALPAHAHLAIAGGVSAAPRFTATRADAEALGLGERECQLLARADGATRLEALAATSGLTAERAWQAFAVAKVLGLTASGAFAQPAPDDEAALLDQKYEQVQSADYFTILGVPRTADADTVQRAHLRLAEQFDPLKYAAHEDPGVLQRAQVIYRHLKDAAHALRDDRRRAEYARHLQEQP
jgi:hypothetical protein